MASTYLNKTYSSAGNRNKWTVSVWLKRSKLGAENPIFFCKPSGNFETFCGFASDDRLVFKQKNDGNSTGEYVTTRKFRDTNGFYNFVFVYDKDNSTAGDRGIIYVNGVRETAFDTSNNFSDVSTWNSTNEMWIGRASSSYFEGVMSHFHFVDGSALAPTVFGSTDSVTGEWKINTSPSYTVGTNGFFILKDGNSVTDSSTNSNAWSVGGGTLTKTEDCPSNVFCTVNPLANYYPASSFANGNTYVSTAGSKRSYNNSTLAASSGKYYWEVKCVSSVGASNGCFIGIASTTPTNDGSSSAASLGTKQYDYGYLSYDGKILENGSYNNYGNSYTDNDIIGVAMDLDNNKLYFSKNGTWQNSGVPTSGSTGTGAFSIQDPSGTVNGIYTPSLGDWWSSGFNVAFNFGNGFFQTTAVSSAGANASGNGIFEYDVPTGYTALSTKGLNL